MRTSFHGSLEMMNEACRQMCDLVYYYQQKFRRQQQLVERLESMASESRFLSYSREKAQHDREMAYKNWVQVLKECARCRSNPQSVP